MIKHDLLRVARKQTDLNDLLVELGELTSSNFKPIDNTSFNLIDVLSYIDTELYIRTKVYWNVSVKMVHSDIQFLVTTQAGMGLYSRWFDISSPPTWQHLQRYILLVVDCFDNDRLIGRYT